MDHAIGPASARCLHSLLGISVTGRHLELARRARVRVRGTFASRRNVEAIRHLGDREPRCVEDEDGCGVLTVTPEGSSSSRGPVPVR